MDFMERRSIAIPGSSPEKVRCRAPSFLSSFVFFRAYYTLLGKAARIYTKKIGAIGYVAKSP